MKSVEDALEWILASVSEARFERATRTESVPLTEAFGRVLAEKHITPFDLPRFDNSAVDGYAVRVAEVAGASEQTPIRLPVSREIAAGNSSEELLEPGTAARIMTGAPVPLSAEAIVMREDTREPGNQSNTDDWVEILEAARTGQHIRRQGEELRAGATLVAANTVLDAATIGLLASIGIQSALCFAAPRVALLTTGDEVVAPGTIPLPPGHLYNSNQSALEVSIRNAGGVLHSIRHLPDNLEATEAAFRELKNLAPELAPDLIVTVGGVSVGDRDFVKPALESLGTLELWKIAMKPGKPLAFGSLGDALFVGLPGNPVSALVCFEIFVRPLIRKLRGYGAIRLSHPILNATLLRPVSHTPGRREFVRAITEIRGGELFVAPAEAQGSGELSGFSGANGLLIVPEESSGLGAGERVRVMLTES